MSVVLGMIFWLYLVDLFHSIGICYSSDNRLLLNIGFKLLLLLVTGFDMTVYFSSVISRGKNDLQ